MLLTVTGSNVEGALVVVVESNTVLGSGVGLEGNTKLSEEGAQVAGDGGGEAAEERRDDARGRRGNGAASKSQGEDGG